MKYWTEMRTALVLARAGTVSGAAAELGLHRATVNRHIDTLEAVFGGPLFQRHARGYSLTEAGQDMLEVASRVDEMLGDLEGRSRNRASQVSGKLIVTAVPGVAPRIMGSVAAFRLAHPDLDLEFRADTDLARLEYGEAHVAVRTGPKPTELDYVVRPSQPIRFGLYASQRYIDREGLPSLDTLDGHQFVVPMRSTSATPYADWLSKHVRPEAFALRCNDYTVRRLAICHGVGIGFIDAEEAEFQCDLVELMPPSDDFAINVWIVTHVDLHRSLKVQAFLDFLK
ncbi:MAG: LysR family transcriptional regulator [Pseudomonadota bacterium]